MDPVLFLEQALNGIQFGVMLFLMAAGLTLIFGIMNFINLAHGSLYMVGAFLAATFLRWTDSFFLAIVLALAVVTLVGLVVEVVALRRFYERAHLDQVVATFGLILTFNEGVRMIWGPTPQYMAVPEMLAGAVEIVPGSAFPAYRLAITAAGLIVGLGLYLLINHTRVGMLIRAGAANREMVSALGVNIRLLFTMVFALGAAFAGLAGMLAAPILAVEVGMGEPILILAFVVIVIGGVGSTRGAFVAALLVGLVDSFGRFLLPQIFGFTVGPALSAMSIYLLMAVMLHRRPEGLFPAARS